MKDSVTERVQKAKSIFVEGAYQMGMHYRGVTTFIYAFLICTALSVSSAENIFGQAQALVEQVYGDIIRISTLAASVAVGVGALMKKFSMGKQDKIEMGNKLIRNSLTSWFVLNSITAILNYLKPFTDQGGGF